MGNVVDIKKYKAKPKKVLGYRMSFYSEEEIEMARRGLYSNINARRKAGTSRPKSKSTISPKAYANMKAGFPKKKKK